ncbi:polyamine ABC transporter substrate-binding protein [Deinococcus hopiensis]|uniref:Spermidine/putrescine transport system substrate-binding protein n=1 Tax=Deinococcus hopiensis KR-140 TaxID=695939 RepID=A0A1W1VFL5_9DEIO|nr:spermidine/putrescine ABC transporter substrate-binding protein [Deinococcus hopiensis]SMB92125.1 spermidine/putrescine transport system substrate-binding protein [Deinococcus hopiensis KR-140]
MKRAVLLLAVLLMACHRIEKKDTAAEGNGTTTPAPTVRNDGRTLRIFMWSDYIDPETVKAFEKREGVRVIIDTFESNEAMLAKLQGGGASYDLVTPSNYVVQTMVRARLLQPMRGRETLKNFGNIAAGFLNPNFDPGNTYTVPYQYAATGLAYNAGRYAPTEESWKLIFGPEDKVRFALLDDPREVIGAALKYLGYSVNSTRVEELRAARDLLRRAVAKKGFESFSGGPEIRNKLLARRLDLGQIYVGDLLQGASEDPDLKVFLPREGTTISTDTLVLLRGSPNPALARRFVDHVLDPQVSAAISNYTFYGNPNRAAAPLLDPFLRGQKAFNPSQEELKSGRVEFINELPRGRTPRLYDRIWTELKSR